MESSKQMTVVDAVRSDLERMSPSIAKALPPHITPAKFIRVAQTAITTNPKLLEADRTSLFAAVVRCAEDGLMPDGKEAALVTFGNKVVNMPMTYGILKKVRNSGELKSITSQVIFEADEFRHWTDETGEHLIHNPKHFTDRGNIVGAYALALTKDGGLYIETMSYEQIEDVRQCSRAKDGDAWKNWWDEMARKTVIRRLSKRLPMSTDLEQVIQREDEFYDFDKLKKAESAPKKSRLEQIVAATTTPPAASGSDEGVI